MIVKIEKHVSIIFKNVTNAPVKLIIGALTVNALKH